MIAGTLAALGAGCAADPGPSPHGERGYRPVMPAAEFDASHHGGEVVVLDFWATWCGPCLAAMPSVQRLHEEFRGRPVRVLGVSTWEGAPNRGSTRLGTPRPPGEPLRVMLDRGCTYGLVTGGDSLAAEFGVGAIPTMVVIGVDGSVIYRAAGSDDGAASVIERHLAEHGL